MGSTVEIAVKTNKRLYKDMTTNYHFVSYEKMGPLCKYLMTCDANSKKCIKEWISIAIRRGNATSILGALPEIKAFEEVLLLIIFIIFKLSIYVIKFQLVK